MNTRQIILDKALEMFNERGIEYVGLRELAAVLGMRVGNITYYFPTKDDLVYELALQLSEANEAAMLVSQNLTMAGFMQMLQQLYQNHTRWRCLLLSVVHLMQQNRHLALNYKQTQKKRKNTLRQHLQALAAGGYLKTNAELAFLVSALSLISRFWISEAAISFPQKSRAGQTTHYLLLVGNLFRPYCTAKGKREIEGFLKASGKQAAVPAV